MPGNLTIRCWYRRELPCGTWLTATPYPRKDKEIWIAGRNWQAGDQLHGEDFELPAGSTLADAQAAADERWGGE